MPSPITPSEIKTSIPSLTGRLCTRFKTALRIPKLFYDLIRYERDDAGNLSEDFVADMCAQLPCLEDGSTPGTGGGIIPQSVSATDGLYYDKVIVTWNAVMSAVAYEVYRSESSSSATALKIGESVTAEYTDNDVTVSKTYYYWVKARTSTETSSFSNYDPGYAGEQITPPVITAVDQDGGFSPFYTYRNSIELTPAVPEDDLYSAAAYFEGFLYGNLKPPEANILFEIDPDDNVNQYELYYARSDTGALIQIHSRIELYDNRDNHYGHPPKPEAGALYVPDSGDYLAIPISSTILGANYPIFNQQRIPQLAALYGGAEYYTCAPNDYCFTVRSTPNMKFYFRGKKERSGNIISVSAYSAPVYRWAIGPGGVDPEWAADMHVNMYAKQPFFYRLDSNTSMVPDAIQSVLVPVGLGNNGQQITKMYFVFRGNAGSGGGGNQYAGGGGGGGASILVGEIDVVPGDLIELVTTVDGVHTRADPEGNGENGYDAGLSIAGSLFATISGGTGGTGASGVTPGSKGIAGTLAFPMATPAGCYFIPGHDGEDGEYNASGGGAGGRGGGYYGCPRPTRNHPLSSPASNIDTDAQVGASGSNGVSGAISATGAISRQNASIDIWFMSK